MAALYKKFNHFDQGVNDDTVFVLQIKEENGDDCWKQIPLFDEENTQTIEYKKWLSEGNTPEAAD